MRVLTLVSIVVFAGCTAATGEQGEEGEEAPQEEGAYEAESVSSVDCRERTDTAYDNGKPYSIKVITIGGKPVSKTTGHAFLKMQRAAHEAGVPLTLTSGFRTNAEQQYLYNCYLTKKCNNGNLAAPPGYSNHQNGKAIDVTTSSWLAKNAPKFGFVRTVPSEPWHWEYEGADPGGPCSTASSTLSWVSPKDGGSYKNGIWMKVRSSDAKIDRVEYWAGSWKLGESKDKAGDFALRYTFSQTGTRSITARGFAGTTQRTSSTITIDVVP
jgi:hypothetical protein